MRREIDDLTESRVVEIDGDTSPLQGALSRLGGRGGAVALAAAAAGAVFSAGFSEALDLTAANNRLTAQLGLTAEESERIGGLASGLYADAWGESIEEVTNAIALIDQNLAEIDDIPDAELETLTQLGLDLARTFDVDVAEATRAAGQLFRSGLADSAEDAFDIITTGFQEGANRSDDFLDVLNEYSVNFAEAGLTSDEVLSAMISQLDEGVFQADRFGDSVKEFGVIIREEEQRVESLQAIGDGIADNIAFSEEFAGVVSESAGTLLDLAGQADLTEAEINDLWATANTETSSAIDRNLQFAESLRGLEGIADSAIDGAIGGAFRDLRQEAGGVEERIFELQNALINGGPEAAGAFQELFDIISSIEDVTQRNTAAVETFGTPFEDISNSVFFNTDFTGTFDDLGGSAQRASDTINDSLTMRLTALQRQALAPIAAFTNSTVIPAIGGFLDIVEGFDIGSLFGGGSALGPISDAFSGAFESISAAIDTVDFAEIAENFEGFLNALEPVIGFVIDVAASTLANFGEVIAGLIGVVGNILEGDWAEAWSSFTGAIDDALILAISLLAPARIAQALGRLVVGALSALGPLGPGLLRAIGTGLGQLPFAITTALARGLTALAGFVPRALGFVAGFGVELGASLTSGLPDVGSRVASSLGSAISSAFTTVLSGAVSFGSSFISTVVDGIAGLAVAIAQALTAAVTAYVNWYASVITTAVEFAINFVSTIVGGIADLAVTIGEALVDAVVAYVNWYADVVETAVGFGIDFIAAIADGLATLAVGIGGALVDGLTAYVEWYAEVVGTAAGFGARFITAVVEGLAGLALAIGALFLDSIQRIVAFYGGGIAEIAGFGADFISTVIDGLSGLPGEIGGVFADAFTTITGFVDDVVTELSSLAGRVTGLFTGIGGAIGGALSGAIRGAVNGVIGAINGIPDITIPIPDLLGGSRTIGIPFVNPVFRGGVLERGEQAFYEGFAREAAIPLDGPFGTIVNKLRLLRESGLYDVVAADIARSAPSLSQPQQSGVMLSPNVSVPIVVSNVTVDSRGMSNDPRRRIREAEQRAARHVRRR